MEIYMVAKWETILFMDLSDAEGKFVNWQSEPKVDSRSKLQKI